MITRVADLKSARRFEDADPAVWLQLAFKVGLYYGRNSMPALSPDDVRGAAALGLAKAMRQFDPARGVKPATYALTLIQGAVLEAMRSADPVPRSRRAQLNAGATEEPRDLHPHSLDFSVVDDGDPIRAAELLEDDRPGPEALTLACSEVAALWSVVDTLPAREALAVRRRYLDGYKFPEIAAELGVTQSRAFQLHQQALGRLRQWLS
jgi:RNA polymerase sigma factor for flagellar operon FliA